VGGGGRVERVRGCAPLRCKGGIANSKYVYRIFLLFLLYHIIEKSRWGGFFFLDRDGMGFFVIIGYRWE